MLIGLIGRGSKHTPSELSGPIAQQVVSQVCQLKLLNTSVTGWDADVARATSEVVFVLKGEAERAVELVGRYHDVLHRDGDRWRFHSPVAEFIWRRVAEFRVHRIERRQ